ncbi:MAG: TonB family protein [Bacteroidales bacterium]|nr:TonB family protein [Bacteroidales bacterium]
MIRWILFSTLASALFYGLYWLLFRNDKQLQVRRWYLMVALAFSLFYSLVRVPVTVEMPTVFTLTDASTLAMLGSPSPDLGAEQEGTAFLIDWSWWIAVLYSVGMALTIGLLFVQVGKTLALLGKLGWHNHVHLLDDDTPPCSFFHHIIIGTRAMNQEELPYVLAHEQEHARRLHSLDVLLMRLLCSLAWFNPFAWLMLRELRAVHEYQADAAAVQRSDYKEYLGLLYRQTTGTGYGHITNNFQSINLKKRITMMKQQKSRFGAWKALAALPVAALLMMVGCQPNPEETATPATEMAQPATADADILDVAEVSPEFPGGVEALYKYLAENIRYPEQAKANKVEGRVFVTFVVEKDGSVTDAKVLRGIGGGCDEEALRVVNAMPRWSPGMQSGVPVRVQFYLPLTFKLQ